MSMITTEKPRFTRFKSIDWFSKTENSPSVLVGGCGGIGSWLSLFLARAGFSPVIHDFDSIEEHNIGGQLLKTKHVGQLKVKAMGEIISEFTGEQKYIISSDKITKDSYTNRYCFSAFDNMEARKDMYHKWENVFGNEKDAIFIDGRLRAEAYEIICVQGQDGEAQERYKKEFLFEDDEVEDALCSLKQTSHMAGMHAGQMCGFFTNFLTNIVEEEEVREVPFFHSYFLPLNMSISYDAISDQ